MQDFMESFEDFGLKIGNYSCLNEYMKICENKRSRSYSQPIALKLSM